MTYIVINFLRTRTIKTKGIAFILVSSIILLGLSVPLYGDQTYNKISVYFEESFAYEAQKNYEASLDTVLKILKIEKDNYTATLRAGWLNYLNGDYQESLRYYKKTISLAPSATEPKLGLMLPLMALKQWSDTAATARKVLRSDPKNYIAGSRLAYALFSQARYGDAEKQYSNIIAAYPSDIEMKLGLGWTYLRMGRKKEAGKNFREVLKVRRNNASALAGMEAIQTE
jgi:tetratricopeptide (TPR) repeat protein